jgi:hypothetical protein
MLSAQVPKGRRGEWIFFLGSTRGRKREREREREREKVPTGERIEGVCPVNQPVDSGSRGLDPTDP